MPVKMFVFELLIAANTSFKPYLGSLLWRSINHVFVFTLVKSMFLGITSNYRFIWNDNSK